MLNSHVQKSSEVRGWPGFTKGDLREMMFSVQGLGGAAHAAGPQPAATKHPWDLLMHFREDDGWMVIWRAKVPDAPDPSADIIPSATDEGFVLRALFFPHYCPGSQHPLGKQSLAPQAAVVGTGS